MSGAASEVDFRVEVPEAEQERVCITVEIPREWWRLALSTAPDSENETVTMQALAIVVENVARSLGLRRMPDPGETA